MTGFIFVVFAGAFLLSCEKQREGKPFAGRERAHEVLVQSGHLFWQILVLFLAAAAVRYFQPLASARPFLGLFYIPCVLVLGSFWGKTRAYQTTLLILSLWILAWTPSPADEWLQLKQLLTGVAIIAAVQLILLGIREKLLLTNIPERIQKLSVELVTASMVFLGLMALGGF